MTEILEDVFAADVEQWDKVDKKYFLSYQVEQIMSEHRMNLTEKSIRVGITFAYAMRGVRRRMLGIGDLLHTSVNERAGKSFIGDCRKFCKLYDVAGATDVNEFEVYNESEDRKETAYEIKFTKQDTAIKVFSSNPDAIRGEGGEVDIDEITSHKRPDEMIQAAGGRAMWGYPVNIWSSHRGMHSALNRMIKEERAKGTDSRWNIKTVTLVDALAAGLLDKINAVSGANMTEEDFLADTKAMVGGEDAYLEECMCIPKMSGLQAIKWQYIDAAKRDHYLHRIHIEGDETFDVSGWLGPLRTVLMACTKISLGYDVARTGHLSAVPILGMIDDDWKLLGLITMRKRAFRKQEDVVAELLRAFPGAVGAGDSTGLGMQVCEDLTNTFSETRFVGVNFGSKKKELGTNMVKVFEDNRCHLPEAREHEDIQFDIAAIQTSSTSSGIVNFVETANPINKLSHCDIAWAIALALMVGEEDLGCGVY